MAYSENNGGRGDGFDIRSNGTDENYPDRKEKVKNFKLHIDDDPQVFMGDEYMSDMPRYKGEVYFANHARKRPPQEPHANAGNTDHRQRRGEPQTVRRTPMPGRTVRMSNEDRTYDRHVMRDQPQRQPSRDPYGRPRQNAPVRQGEARKRTPDAAKKRKKKKKGASVFSGTLRLLTIIFVSVGILSTIAILGLNDILAIGGSSDPVTVEIPANATTNEVINILAKDRLIRNPLMCKAFYKAVSTVKKSSADPVYLEGIFYLKQDMGLEGMLGKLKETQHYTETVTLSFPEGWSVSQMFEKLEKNKVCDADYLYKAARSVNFNFAFLSSAKQADQNKRFLMLEGYFFPDTYEFYVDLNANSVIERFLENFRTKWTDEYAKRAAELGYTTDDIIKIASIIQREAANSDQMTLISSILHNRLNHQVDYPTLGCDSTANYIRNYVKPVIGSINADRLLQYYDTALIAGLPSGPICNPGGDAIYAALYPDDTDYYYFQHDSYGKIYPAKTNAEHNRIRNQIALQGLN
ncbi:MAG: endolytic transglycosylase MltG [Clostridiales bacterium]|nr:endolytic transglycosylase MltG [Clostridiales bacterium]